MITADDIPVAFTPAGGWTEVPPPFLAGCTEPIVKGAPDMRGTWKVVSVEVGGSVDPSHPAIGKVQRIEQAGNRVIVTAAGIVHDMRCDGTEEHGVHDVAEFDKTTPITVVATFEDGVHILRPVGVPLEVTRRIEGDQLVWTYVGFTARLERISPLNALRDELAAQAEALRNGATVPSGGISFGKRVGEGTSIAIERFADVAIHDQIVHQLAQVDAALERLDDGTYGICTGCGRPISSERLEAVPWAATCVACA